MSATQAALPASGRAFLGHPKGLGYLSFTEAGERFSDYATQSLLVLYMVHALLGPERAGNMLGLAALRGVYGGIGGQPFASAIFGAYTACVYLTPIVGGSVADRLLVRKPKQISHSQRLLAEAAESHPRAQANPVIGCGR